MDDREKAQMQPEDVRFEGSSADPGEGAPTSLAYARLAVSLARGVAWPLLVLGVLVVYGGTIRRVVDAAAGRIATSSKVSVGSFSFEVVQEARKAGSADLAEAVGQLSATSVRLLLQSAPEDTFSIMDFAPEHGPGATGQSYYELATASERSAIDELGRNGLVASTEPLVGFVEYFEDLVQKYPHIWASQGDLIPANKLKAVERARLDAFRYWLTPKGKRAASVVVEVVARQLSEGSGKPQ